MAIDLVKEWVVFSTHVENEQAKKQMNEENIPASREKLHLRNQRSSILNCFDKRLGHTQKHAHLRRCMNTDTQAHTHTHVPTYGLIRQLYKKLWTKGCILISRQYFLLPNDSVANQCLRNAIRREKMKAWMC